MESSCIWFIAIEQPVASDLMYIESSIRIISHIKRISHLFYNIAESSKELVDIDVPKIIIRWFTIYGGLCSNNDI